MKRYFIEIAYDGSRFCGWQKQDNVLTIQGHLESILSQLYNRPIEIVGCGRTDTSVHASQYYFHLDIDENIFNSQALLYKLNNMAGQDIAVHRIIEVHSEAHARFDANSRSYSYYIGRNKDPFYRHFRYQLPQALELDLGKLQEAASLLLSYKSFFPFCKSNSDVLNYNCSLTQSEWIAEDNVLIYRVTADRFLRGMVRLIVGMCINVSQNKLKLQEINKALQTQERLSTPFSVPGHALFLDKVNYPYIQ